MRGGYCRRDASIAAKRVGFAAPPFVLVMIVKLWLPRSYLDRVRRFSDDRIRSVNDAVVI